MGEEIFELARIELVMRSQTRDTSRGKYRTYVHIIELVLIVAPYRIIEVIARTKDSNCLISVVFVEGAWFESL